jgi:hypothetical protein
MNQPAVEPKIDPHSEAFLHRLMERQLRLVDRVRRDIRYRTYRPPLLNYYAP